MLVQREGPVSEFPTQLAKNCGDLREDVGVEGFKTRVFRGASTSALNYIFWWEGMFTGR